MRLILQSILFVYISFSCLSCYKEEVLYTPIFDKTLEISPLLRLNNAPCGFDSQLSLLRVSIKNDTIYIFTDGFVDQFGGDNNKKFKTNSFKKLLLSVQDKTMLEQKEIINKVFEEWRGDNEQIDDVCVIGIKI